MKFRTLTFRRFGAFADRTLDFGANGQNLHVIYGSNEAGKSTALKGITYFLFGFPKAGTHDFRFRLTEQRVASTFVDQSANEWSAIRRRGNKNTLREADDKSPFPEEMLQKTLGGLDEAQYAMLFGLDHAQLVAGGDTITKGEGGLGQALFAAGAGLAGLRRIDDRLEGRLNDLFKPNGSNQKIAETLRLLKAEKQALREQILAIDKWLAQKDQLAASVAKKKELEDERQRLRLEQDELKNYKAALPTLASIRNLEELLRPFADAPLLPEDFGVHFRSASEEMKIAQMNRDRLRQELDVLQVALDANPPEPNLLAEDEAILQIKEDLGAILKAERDRVELAQLEGRYRDSVQKWLTAIDKSADASVAILGLTSATVEQIRAFGQARGGLAAAVENLRERLAALDATIADLERTLADSGPTIDRETLEQLDRAVLLEGPLERDYAAKQAELSDEQDLADRELAKLAPYWQGPIQTAARLRVPPPQRVAQFETGLAQIDSDMRECRKGRDQEAKTIRHGTSRLAMLEQGGRLPDEAELRAARQDRDGGFEALVADTEAPDFARRHAAPNDLAQAVRNSMRACDELGDSMRRETARGSEAAQCRADLRKAHEELAAAEAALAELAARRTELLAHWASEWAAEKIDAGLPDAMRLWVDQLSAVKSRAERLEKLAPAVNKLSESIEKHKMILRAALGISDADSPRTLDQLHAQLKRTLDADRAARDARMKDDAKRQAARDEREGLVRSLAQAERQWAAWREEWGRSVAMLGLDPTSAPVDANRRLDELAAAQRDLHEADRLLGRLKSMERDRAQFALRLEALCDRLDGRERTPVETASLQITVDGLMRRMNEAKLRGRERAKCVCDCEAARANLADAESAFVTCQVRLQSLCDQAGFANADQMPALIDRSERRRFLEERRAQAQSDLRHHAGSKDVAEFVARAETNRTTLDARLAEIAIRMESIDAEIPGHAVSADAASKQLELWQAASSLAADRQQTIESLHARLRNQATEYTAVHLARQTLRLAVERFRQRREGTLLSGAERFFQILTRGAFAGLEIDEDGKGEPILKAVRREPNEHVEIAGLSDGTRDQLFLALRLAGIEQHVRAHGPMPVIADDLLVNFDDARAAATLECLAELSKLTQVMVFTHHAHVVELARKVADDVVCCHDLSASTS
jgi:uncharacterized protein YhaN